ncbi:TPA: hypothetical protein ACGXMH_001358 [Bacillus mobilis]|uniref:hypothetical protein n=1 Tax=Bacillus mobilis TaxID=2026190 RepID=UPI00119F7BCE|nr:hypothetical protein [Bacillus mobilis]MED4385016.1 hypothetical protein [Bacillus mobilis]HDX9638964.1 hypothetical protein [Bacillus mobilis]
MISSFQFFIIFGIIMGGMYVSSLISKFAQPPKERTLKNEITHAIKIKVIKKLIMLIAIIFAIIYGIQASMEASEKERLKEIEENREMHRDVRFYPDE